MGIPVTVWGMKGYKEKLQLDIKSACKCGKDRNNPSNEREINKTEK